MKEYTFYYVQLNQLYGFLKNANYKSVTDYDINNFLEVFPYISCINGKNLKPIMGALTEAREPMHMKLKK